jgi:hypothetical protein
LWETESVKTNAILEEVWQIKDRLAADAGYDIDRFVEQLRAWSAAHPATGRVVHNAAELHRLATGEVVRYSSVAGKPAQVREKPAKKRKKS